MSAYLGRHISADDLGRLSCEIEIERCGEPIGKQDQYAAAYGGLNLIEFKADDSVLVTPVIMPPETRKSLERRILVFYTGITRSASQILRAQSEAVVSDHASRGALIRMVELAYALREELQGGNLETFGEILHDNWNLKKTLTNGVSSTDIDTWYELGRHAGATGGKILGAGSGGFLMFYAHEDRHPAIEAELNFLRRVDFRFDPLGSRIIFYNPRY